MIKIITKTTKLNIDYIDDWINEIVKLTKIK